jgi:hypothetical protein
MHPHKQAAHSFKTILLELGRLIFIYLFPYLGNKKRIDKANIIRLISPREAYGLGLSNTSHWAEVKVEWHKDSQTLYTDDYHERRGYVRLSPKFFKYAYPGMSIIIMYQRNRNPKLPRVRAKIMT